MHFEKKASYNLLFRFLSSQLPAQCHPVPANTKEAGFDCVQGVRPPGHAGHHPDKQSMSSQANDNFMFTSCGIFHDLLVVLQA